MKIKPTLEKLSPKFGQSIVVRQHTKKAKDYKPFWHFHPEIELVYVNKAKGKRHIGNHLSYYNNSQLLLIGENLPHNGFTDRFTSKGKETVIQFKSDFLGRSFFKKPEMQNIQRLFERSRKGLLFKPQTKQVLGWKIERLAHVKGFERLLMFLEILNGLALATDYVVLNADGFLFETEPQDVAKIDIIYKYVNQHFTNHISLDEIADKVSMTIPAFCRYFKKVTGKTFTQLVNEYRVVHATKLLQESKLSITDICFECGFNNFSHFNKQFKNVTQKSASAYRRQMKQLIQ